MVKRLVVIGGVAAGMSAAAKARRTDRGLEVVVYERVPTSPTLPVECPTPGGHGP